MAVTNLRTALITGGGLVQLLIPARQRNCPLHMRALQFQKSLWLSVFPPDTRRGILGHPLGIMGIFLI